MYYTHFLFDERVSIDQIRFGMEDIRNLSNFGYDVVFLGCIRFFEL
jgi:hypothetical protein